MNSKFKKKKQKPVTREATDIQNEYSDLCKALGNNQIKQDVLRGEEAQIKARVKALGAEMNAALSEAEASAPVTTPVTPEVAT